MSQSQPAGPRAAPPPEDARRHIEALIEIMARLRHPDGGCPWDLEQDFATIAPYTIEEAYEVADAIEKADMAGLKGELGDLLLQVVFHAQMAREAGHFEFGDVVQGICDKMVRRHPHVFAAADAATPDAVMANWEAIKAAERAQARQGTDDGPVSVLDDVPVALPALMRSAKLIKRVRRIGFDWPDALGALDKVEEETAELREALEAAQDDGHIAEELGDLLFTVANVAAKIGRDPEDLLRAANAKFERRFRGVEARLAADGLKPEDADLETMESHWQAVKAAEKSAG